MMNIVENTPLIKIKVCQMTENHVLDCLQLILRNLNQSDQIFNILKPSLENLFNHYLPVLNDKDTWKYSFVFIDKNTNKIVGFCLQKDISDETLPEDRILSDIEEIAYQQKINWEVLDRGLQSKSQECYYYKDDKQSEQILGNIVPKTFMFQVLNLVDRDYLDMKLGFYIQLFAEQIAIGAGFVWGIQCANQKNVSMGKSLKCSVDYELQLSEHKFNGRQIFNKNQSIYSLTSCYQDPIKKEIINKIYSQQPKL